MSDIKKISDNWRNISKSDYLASIDVESIIKNNGRCILTIEKAVQHLAEDDQYLSPKQQFRVNGNRGDFNIVHFVQDVKPLVANVTNSQTLWRFIDTGKAEDESVACWQGLNIELVVDKSIEFAGNKGSTVILNQLPVIKKPVLSSDNPDWVGWKDKVSKRIDEEYDSCADLEVAKATILKNLGEHFTISEDDWQLLCS